MLYALRVSKCVATAKHFGTLVSRWRVASGDGTGGMTGLAAGSASPNREKISNFLAAFYLRKLCELSHNAAAKAERAALRARTPADRQSAFRKAAESVRSAMSQTTLGGAAEHGQQWFEYLEQRANGMAVDFPELPKNAGK